MLHLVLLATLSIGAELGPVLPPGLNGEFSSAVLKVETRLQASDFVGASKIASLLPSSTVVVRWDDLGVPPKDRAAFVLQRNKAFEEWRSAANVKVVLSPKHANVSFAFAPALQNSPRMGLPMGLASTWSSDVAQTRMRCTIGLQRGNPAIPIGLADVHNAVSQAIGSYLGLASSPFPGTLMGDAELSFPQSFSISSSDVELATSAIRIANDLRAHARDKKPVTPAEPTAVINIQALELGEALQGESPKFSLRISNNGNAPLALRFVPDCGCVVTDRTASVRPGSSFDLEGWYDTTVKFGDIRHTLTVNTNDLENPSVQIPVHIVIRAKYRLLMPDGDTVGLSADGGEFTAYLLMPSDSKTTITAASIGGIEGDTTISRWSGMLADTDLAEPARERTGYKIVAHLSGKSAQNGRVSATLVVRTDDPQFMTLVRTFNAQRGIAATPSEIYMGEVGAGTRNYSLFVSGVGGNFHVKKVTSTWPHLIVQVITVKEGAEYRIQASYDGKGTPGSISANILIETDDKGQPTITIPISGRVI